MRPRAVDAGIAGIAALACGIILTGRTGATVAGTGPPDWIAALLLPVPLIRRRDEPVLVFTVVTVLTWGTQASGLQNPAALLVPLLALHALARYRPARYVWPAAVVTVLPGLGARENWVAVVAVAALVLAVALIGISQRTRAAYLRELEERARRLEVERDQRARLAVAHERARIAREMHDVVAHHIAVMIALSDGAAATAAVDPVRAAGVMGRASAVGREAMSEMRRLVGLLHDFSGTAAVRAPQPGLADVDALIDRVRTAGLKITFTREGVPGDWGPGAGLAIYRVVQEALTNVLKHAAPGAASEVTLRYDPASAEISVVDDGAGRSAPDLAADGRHGLAGMRERIAAYDGRVDAGPLPGAGWRVHATLRFR
ncbi:sensor histidine kinase [Actinoplanes sp. NPDC020271]|uniref:sensor histidine kinase n=1 Tax=Actinoplanes sp. NPDC020271 TaxID=3363896 RepID=UPI0037909D8A